MMKEKKMENEMLFWRRPFPSRRLPRRLINALGSSEKKEKMKTSEKKKKIEEQKPR